MTAEDRLAALAEHFHRSIIDHELRIPCVAHAGEDDNLAMWVDSAKDRLGAKCYSQGCSYKNIATVIEYKTGVSLRSGHQGAHKRSWAYPDGYAVYRTDRYDTGGGYVGKDVSQTKGAPAGALYFRSPDGDAGDPRLIIVEGEQAVDYLASLGYSAVTWRGGAQSASAADWGSLQADAGVILWPDDDPQGIKAMEAIAAQLAGKVPVLYWASPSGYTGDSKSDVCDLPPHEVREVVAEAQEYLAPEHERESPESSKLSLTELANLFFSHYADRLRVVDKSFMYLRRGDGCWVDITSGGPAIAGAFQNMPTAFGADVSGPQGAKALQVATYRGIDDPGKYNLLREDSRQFDRRPVFPTRDGNAVDLQTYRVMSADDAGQALMLDRGGRGVDFRPRLDLKDSKHPGYLLAQHYGKDGLPPVGLFTRIALLLLRPRKGLDVIMMPLSGAGKSTLCDWLTLAFPGYALVGSAVNLLSAQGQKFTAVQDRLSRYRLVLLDEADKLDAPVPASTLNALTSEVVTVELKGVDSGERPRIGNTVFVSSQPPMLEVLQGGPERLAWAFDGSHVEPMSQQLRDHINDPDAQAWLATWLAQLAFYCRLSGDTAETAESRRAASWVVDSNRTPLQFALNEVLEVSPGSFVTNDEIKDALREYPEAAQESNSRTLPKMMDAVFGRQARRERTAASRGYTGVKRKEEGFYFGE